MPIIRINQVSGPSDSLFYIIGAKTVGARPEILAWDFSEEGAKRNAREYLKSGYVDVEIAERKFRGIRELCPHCLS